MFAKFSQEAISSIKVLVHVCAPPSWSECWDRPFKGEFPGFLDRSFSRHTCTSMFQYTGHRFDKSRI